MAAQTSTKTSIPSADCDVVDTKIEGNPERIQLCLREVPRTPSEKMDLTSKYASDPTKYLKEILGDEVFEQRKHMLSLPETVDRDMYGDGAHKDHFEHHIASVLGKKHGLFFLTGVQAQLAAMKTYCVASENNRVAWHVSSHLESAEQNSYDMLYNLERTFLGSDPNELPTVEEIKSVVKLPEDQRPAAVLVEIPNRVLGCKTYTFGELAQISAVCREADVKFHCDAARLWEGEAYYQATAGKSFEDIAHLFDSVYVSFYKGLGGVTGAVLVSDDEHFMASCKQWQRRAGGNAFTLMYEIIDCERGYNENIGTFAGKRRKMIEVVQAVTASTERFTTPDGQKIVSFVPEEATCCQIHTYFRGYTAQHLEAARDAAQQKTNIRVFERVRPKKTVELTKTIHEKKADKERANGIEPLKHGELPPADDSKVHFLEWMIHSVTEKVDTQVFVNGYVALCEELVSRKEASNN